MSHTIILPTSAFLGNFEKFTNINTFPTNQSPIQLQPQNSHFISLHPVISAMLATLGVSKSPYMTPIIAIRNSTMLEEFFIKHLPSYNLNPVDSLLVKYILSELTRNTLEHGRTSSGAMVAISYGKKSNTLRLGVADSGVGIPTTIRQLYPTQNDFQTLITALTPGITGTTNFAGGNTQNAGAGLFFVKSLAHQLGSHFLIYSGTGLFKLLKRKTKHSILRANSAADHASGNNDYPFWNGTVVGVDIPLGTLPDFNQALTQIRKSFYNSLQNEMSRPSTEAQFI